jgi:putative aldouronate transport system permease protein
MVQTRSATEYIVDVLIIVMLLMLTLVTLYPFLYVVNSSFSDPVERHYAGSLLLFPQGFTVEGYEKVLDYKMVWIGLRNTVIYVALGTVIAIVMTSMASYCLAHKYPGRNFLMKIIIFTMYFSGGLIPKWLLMERLGLLDTVAVMVVPGAITVYYLIIMMTYFKGIPASMEDSARMDGANDFVILFRIILPLAIPVVAVIILFQAVSEWNSFFEALIYLRDRNRVPLQVVLREVLIQEETMDIASTGQIDEAALIQENMKFAITVVSIVPIILVYPFLQRYFVKGIMIGSLKY